MIVELFGLPGSGKSYYSKELESKYNFKDKMYFYKENFLGKILFHLILKFCLMNKKFRKNFNDILEIIDKNDSNLNLIDQKDNMDLYIKYMIIIYFIESKKNKKNIVLDEGIVHYCMVLYAEFSVEKSKCSKILDYFDSKVYPKERKVYKVICDRKILMERIKKRNRKSAPIDFLTGEKLTKILNRYDEFIEIFKDRYENFNNNDFFKIMEEKLN